MAKSKTQTETQEPSEAPEEIQGDLEINDETSFDWDSKLGDTVKALKGEEEVVGRICETDATRIRIHNPRGKFWFKKDSLKFVESVHVEKGKSIPLTGNVY